MPEGEKIEDEEAEEEQKEEEEPGEPREEIKIKDFSEFKPCSICKELKTPYIEIEVGGRLEYTCRSCYEAKYSPKPKIKCPSCSYECNEDDNFCWKCGARLRLICTTCGTKSDVDDKFCRQCGSKL